MTTRRKSPRWSSIVLSLTVACLAGSLSAQDRPRHAGLPEDWSHRHLIFSNPGTSVQMLDKRVSEERRRNWRAVQQDIRFRMQQAKRNLARVSQGWDSTATMAPALDMQAGNARFAGKALARASKPAVEAAKKKPPKVQPSNMQRDWSMDLGASPPVSMYPAKFSFDVNGTPDCVNDFVVFPIGDFATVGQQAKLIAFNNLYTPGLCGPATDPTFKFAYVIGSGVVQTSPVLSLDGTKIAFVESRTGGPIGTDFPNFHVLTIGTTGDNGDDERGVAPGPGGGNNAVDTFVQMSGGGSVTRSSPFVDYEFDEAFVGDDHGNLHKFTGVFKGTLAEVVDGTWPMSVGDDTILTSPVVYQGRIYFGGDNGRLYCALAIGGFCPTSSIAAGDRAILDGPIVDGSTNRVFVATANGDNAVLVQATTGLTDVRTVLMGNDPLLGFEIHNGAFDHKYRAGADPSAGFMYFCGVATSGSAPTLYRVGFDALGRVNGTRDVQSLQLTNAISDEDVCSPLTTIYNPNTPGGPTDLLFVTIARNTQHGCRGPDNNCLASLDITSLQFPTGFRSIFQLPGSGQGTSAIVVDNVADVVPTWLASTAYALGALIVDSNGNVQQCLLNGTSKAGSHPAWSTTVFGTTSDNNTLWLMRGPYKGSWQPNHAYNPNDVITDGVLAPGGTLTPHLQWVALAGTSGLTQPPFSGPLTTDGGVTWISLGGYAPSSVSSVYFSDVGAKLAYKLTQAGLQ